MNLHALVRNLINYIHADEPCVLYQSTGQTNTKGKISNAYTTKNVMCQIQPTPSTLRQIEKYSGTENRMRCYMYSDSTLPVNGISRLPVARTGDFIYRNSDQGWYLVVMVDDWSTDGWCSLEIEQQINPPDLTEVENA